ncbi:MAG: adventurous gliding motility lipoprotein CglB [Myxococcales bacterium]|nr:adventurous gliding motility lipoprotein CglB [Myxococcales bacterium]MDP3501633.1 adventurous gliding motility lipoprotein CglB [Myxococcales bacterium]
MTRLLVPALLLATAACQTYDFEPVTPIAISQTTQTRNVVARNLKPNLMILVDKSGSMNAPLNASAPTCGTCSGATCPATCPTRISELRTAMGQFLTTSSTVARMGLAFYPKGEEASFSPTGCAPTREIAVELPVPSNSDTDTMPLTMNATTINQRIQSLGSAIPVVGGTPTGGALTFLGSYAGLLDDRDNRQDFVLLLTDGLPNCNPANPLSCSSMPPPPANLCTLGANCVGQYCRAGFLDKDGVVTAVKQLRTRNVSTIVVGFGSDFAAPEALDVLNTMAIEGGFGRQCPMGTDAECGANNTCLPAAGGVMTRFCQKQFYSAANATELARALADIQNLLGAGDPCNFKLADRPPEDRFLAVIINGQTTTKGPNTWSLLPPDPSSPEYGSVQFAGQLCDRVRSSTTAEPLKVEFRIVSTL